MPEPDQNEAETARHAELRALFVAPERRQIDVRAQVAARQARALDVSEVLPDAIAQGASDPHLARALTPAVEEAIRLSARNDPRALVEALLPVIGRNASQVDRADADPADYARVRGAAGRRRVGIPGLSRTSELE